MRAQAARVSAWLDAVVDLFKKLDACFSTRDEDFKAMGRQLSDMSAHIRTIESSFAIARAIDRAVYHVLSGDDSLGEEDKTCSVSREPTPSKTPASSAEELGDAIKRDTDGMLQE
jgi:hypothetical protein